jgi:hypothetical protein
MTRRDFGLARRVRPLLVKADKKVDIVLDGGSGS